MKKPARYKFFMSHNCDVMLRRSVGKEWVPYNFGYSGIETLPCILWLGYMQLTGENLLKRFKTESRPKAYEQFRSSYGSIALLEETIEHAYKIAEKLPLKPKDYALETTIARFHGIGDGFGHGVFFFELTDNNTIKVFYKTKEEGNVLDSITFEMGKEDLKDVAKSYLRLTKDEHVKGGTFENIILETFHQLKQYHKPNT